MFLISFTEKIMLEFMKNVENPGIDFFKYLVKLTLNQKVSWTSLVTFLNDLTSTYEASKKLNAELLEELQTLHLKTINTQIQITNIGNEEERERFENSVDEDVTILSSKQEPFDEELSFIENNFSADHSVNEKISPPETNDGEVDINVETKVTENYCSNKIEDMEFCETSSLIEEDKEDITNHDFEIEGDEATLDKSNDSPIDKNADCKIDVAANTDEKANENAEILYSNDQAENELEGSPNGTNDSLQSKNQSSDVVTVLGNKKYACDSCGQLFK